MEAFFTIMLAVQFLHSVEELTSRFHERCPFFSVSLRTFVLSQVLFLAFWVFILLYHGMPFRDLLMAFFIVLMFVNGVAHVVWWGDRKEVCSRTDDGTSVHCSVPGVLFQ